MDDFTLEIVQKTFFFKRQNKPKNESRSSLEPKEAVKNHF
jgi:hypothetical protein